MAQKPPFDTLTRGIPKHQLKKEIGIVNPGKRTQLLLDPDLEWMIDSVQDHAVCSPDTLARNLQLVSHRGNQKSGMEQFPAGEKLKLSLSPMQISAIAQAYPGQKSKQLRAVITKWIEAVESRATVQALLEGLYQSDEVQLITRIHDILTAQGS